MFDDVRNVTSIEEKFAGIDVLYPCLCYSCFIYQQFYSRFKNRKLFIVAKQGNLHNVTFETSQHYRF